MRQDPAARRSCEVPVAGEALIVGGLCAIAVVLSSTLWHLWVHPDLVLSLLADRPDGEDEPQHRVRAAAALRGLRWGAALMVFATGFVTGVSVAMLARANGAEVLTVRWFVSLFR
jgi:hypothetical protein